MAHHGRAVYYDPKPEFLACQIRGQPLASDSAFGATKSNRLSVLAPPRPAGRGGWGEWGPEVRRLGSLEVRKFGVHRIPKQRPIRLHRVRAMGTLGSPGGASN